MQNIQDLARKAVELLNSDPLCPHQELLDAANAVLEHPEFYRVHQGNKAEAYYMKARALIRLGRKEEALPEAIRAVRLDSDRFMFYVAVAESAAGVVTVLAKPLIEAIREGHRVFDSPTSVRVLEYASLICEAREKGLEVARRSKRYREGGAFLFDRVLGEGIKNLIEITDIARLEAFGKGARFIDSDRFGVTEFTLEHQELESSFHQAECLAYEAGGTRKALAILAKLLKSPHFEGLEVLTKSSIYTLKAKCHLELKQFPKALEMGIRGLRADRRNPWSFYIVTDAALERLQFLAEKAKNSTSPSNYLDKIRDFAGLAYESYTEGRQVAVEMGERNAIAAFDAVYCSNADTVEHFRGGLPGGLLFVDSDVFLKE